MREDLILSVKKDDIGMRVFGLLKGKKASENVYLALLQAMHDMAFSGEHGDTFQEVLRLFFKEKCAVKESLDDLTDAVFFQKKKRFDHAKILYICPYEEYKNEEGEPDEEKLGSVFYKYRYIGKDVLPSGNGFFYFGFLEKYRLSFGSYRLLSNAVLMKNKVRNFEIPCSIAYENGRYQVYSPVFFEKDALAYYQKKLQSQYRLTTGMQAVFC